MSHVASKSETMNVGNKPGILALFSAMVVTLIAFAAIATGTALAQDASQDAVVETETTQTQTVVQHDCGEREVSGILSSTQNGGSPRWRSG
ncbi:MAG: hypothetical protein KF813_11125 [Trueperaceae bacterium]|nr:hypothetical protein [Trueperaceae bacterium]